MADLRIEKLQKHIGGMQVDVIVPPAAFDALYAAYEMMDPSDGNFRPVSIYHNGLTISFYPSDRNTRALEDIKFLG